MKMKFIAGTPVTIAPEGIALNRELSHRWSRPTNPAVVVYPTPQFGETCLVRGANDHTAIIAEYFLDRRGDEKAKANVV